MGDRLHALPRVHRHRGRRLVRGGRVEVADARGNEVAVVRDVVHPGWGRPGRAATAAVGAAAAAAVVAAAAAVLWYGALAS